MKRSTPKPEVRHAVINAASQIIEDSGLQAATLPELCNKVGISAAAMYRHFYCRDDLLEAVSHAAGDRLLQEVQAALSGLKKGSNESIAALSFACVSFARREPQIFRLMRDRDEWPDYSNEIHQLFEKLISIRTERLVGVDVDLLIDHLLAIIFQTSCIVSNGVYIPLESEISMVEVTSFLIEIIFSQIPDSV